MFALLLSVLNTTANVILLKLKSDYVTSLPKTSWASQLSEKYEVLIIIFTTFYELAPYYLVLSFLPTSSPFSSLKSFHWPSFVGLIDSALSSICLWADSP